MSRKSYMWNRNNSYAYSDPTGYIADVSSVPGADGTTTVNVTAYVAFTGDGDSQEAEQKVIHDIESEWSGSFGKYNVKVTLKAASESTPAGKVNLISISADPRSRVNAIGVGGRKFSV